MCVSLCVWFVVCVCVLQGQEQNAQGEDEKDGENFAAEGEKTRAEIRAAVCAFCSHNVRNVAQRVTTCKKKVRSSQNNFSPYLLACCPSASDTRE